MRAQRRWWTLGGFLGIGLAVALAIAIVASPFASSSPDGLSRVSIDKGFDDTEEVSPVEAGSPVGGYAVKGVDQERVSTGLAGGIGVVVTFVLVGGVLLGLRRLRDRPGAGAPVSGSA